MKRKQLLALLLGLTLLTGCGQKGGESVPSSEPGEGSGPAAGTLPSLEKDEVPAYVTCRIVDGAEEGALLLAELDDCLYDGHDGRSDGRSVYRLAVKENIPVYLDGEKASADALTDGMPVEIAFNGNVMETFPAQLGEVYSISAWSIGTPQSPGGSFYDLCGLYLKVLDDLWNVDPGLNSDISVAGVDLSQAPGGLLESEKAALAWRFGELHGVEVVTGTFDELVEQGYITDAASGKASAGVEHPLYQWEDGCLFVIDANEDHAGEDYSLVTLFFNAWKWRSGDGGYYYYDCSVLWPQGGSWSGYQVGSELIS